MKLSALLFIVFLAFNSNAQVKMGLTLGLGQSMITNSKAQSDPDISIARDLSMNAGLSLNVKLTERSSLMFELLLSSIRSRESHNNGCYSVRRTGSSRNTYWELVPIDCNADVIQEYISVPATYSFTFSNFSINAGLSFSYLIQSFTDVEFLEPVADFGHAGDFHFDEHFSSMDYGGVIEFGYNFSDQFFLYTRYYHGLKDIWESSSYLNEKYIRQFLFGAKLYFVKPRNFE